MSVGPDEPADPDDPADADTPADASDAASSRRRRLLLVGVAVLAVVTLALGAAALDDLRLSSSGGAGGPESPDTPADDRSGASQSGGDPGSGSATMSPWYVLGVFVLMVGAALLIGWRRDVRRVYLLMGLVIAFGILVATYADPLQTIQTPNVSGGAPGTPPNESVGGAGGGSTPGEAPPANALPTSVLLFVGVALGMAAILGFSRRGSMDASGEAGDTAGATEQVADLGDAAGRAADRIGGADVENAVYRAWHDMTDALDVPAPETTTPAEFREEAVAAGLPEAPVRDLTAVFRDVRYGDASPSPEREERARDALREVEAAAKALAAEEEATEADEP